MKDTRAAGSMVRSYALPPGEIEARSLALMDERLGGRFAEPSQRSVATRILYAAGDPTLAGQIRISPDAVAAGIDAVRRGCNVIADVSMVVAGLDQARLRALGCSLHCAIGDAEVGERARAVGLPRAVEAIRSLAAQLFDGIAVIGNAPTALLALLDLIDAGATAPSLVIAAPVGLVAAAEAKQELALRSVPQIAVEGTRGGSPLAAAALNAMLRLALPELPARRRDRTAVLFAGHGSRAAGAAEAMLAAVERVRRRGAFPIVETGYLELCQPDLPAALCACVEQGASRVLVVPYFLHNGIHIRRDIPAVMRRELARYPGLQISIGRPIGLHADFANVMLAGALEAEEMSDLEPEARMAPVTPPDASDEDDDE